MGGRSRRRTPFLSRGHYQGWKNLGFNFLNRFLGFKAFKVFVHRPTTKVRLKSQKQKHMKNIQYMTPFFFTWIAAYKYYFNLPGCKA